jgi:hypothetical protein
MSIKSEVERLKQEHTAAAKAKQTEQAKKGAAYTERERQLEQHLKKQETELNDLGIKYGLSGGRAILNYKHASIFIDVGLNELSAFVAVPKSGLPVSQPVRGTQKKLKDWTALDAYIGEVIDKVNQNKL